MATEYKNSDAEDELNLPVAKRNLIGMDHVLGIKHGLEDSDVDKVSGPQENKRNSNAKVAVDTQKKRKRYINDGSELA
nr:hypothetical protein [Tanacetum cinerariifolium]